MKSGVDFSASCVGELEMKRAFIIAEGCHIASALVPAHTKDALRVGDRIFLAEGVDLGYAGKIGVGEEGTVDFIDAATGFTEILMDVLHRGLVQWENHIWIEPFGTEDIIGALCVLHRAWVTDVDICCIGGIVC